MIWEVMRKSAKLARSSPAWAKAGINLNPVNYETFRGEGRMKVKSPGVRAGVTATLAEVHADAAAVLRLASRHGKVTVVNARGETCITIVVDQTKLPYSAEG